MVTNMTRKTLVASLTVLALGAAPALADGVFIASQKPIEYLAKDRLIGAKVTGADGKIIGDIEDLIIDNTDHVAGVIMGVGGFLGVGEKKIAVATSALKLEVTDGKMNVSLAEATKEALSAAPAYQRVSPPKGVLERASEKMLELRDKSSESAKDAYDSAKQNAGPALESAKQKANEALEQAKGAAKSLMDKAKDAAKPADTGTAH